MGYFSCEEWASGAHVFGVATSLSELKQRLGELLSPRDASVGGTSALSDD